MKTTNWRKYIFEIISIFLGITLAFGLNKWNDDRRDAHSETKILSEMRHGLELDLQDLNQNMMGHQQGIEACVFFRQLINNETVSKDSLNFEYFMLWRDFISIQNKTGYESLKSKGLELIQNDSLRFDIIELYDFHYEILEKLEEEYSEMQYNKTYFHPINDLLAEYMIFDEQGELTDIKQPIRLSKKDKNRVLSFLKRMKESRAYRLKYYKIVKEKIEGLVVKIEEEL